MKNLWISIKITLAMCVLLTVGYVLILRLTAAVASPNDGEAPTRHNGTVVPEHRHERTKTNPNTKQCLWKISDSSSRSP